MQTREIPDRSGLIDYNYAVAGHAGTMCDVDGLLFIKPCTKQEISFYESARAYHQNFYDIMPVFMGTLGLNDMTDVTSINEQLPAVADHISQEMKEQVVQMAAQRAREAPEPEAPKDNITWIPQGGKKISTNMAVVLENATYGFKRPNILDVKLGVRLYSDDAPLQKKQRFEKLSAETTHGDLGFRISGMRVYKGSEKEEDLDEEQYKIYDKDYGRVDINSKNILDAFRSFIFNKAAGIDEPLAKAVAEVFLKDLERVKDALEQEESRMYSSSLLFVFEGDGDVLRAMIEEHNASDAEPKKVNGEKPGRTTARVDSGIDMGEDGEMIVSDDDDCEDLPRPWALRLIDFAHAAFTPGQGPDENTLTGVRSLIDIFSELSK